MTQKDKPSNWAELGSAFNTCHAINSNEDAYVYLAMIDYPYPNDFLMPVPGWPVNASC
jgi:lysosomal Pro-X carboxypeptidase